VREAANRVRCQNNLKQLSLACHGFESAYGFFPSSVKKTGPERSWAVQMLPWIEQGTVARLYDYKKPWYDPANANAVSQQIPLLYCPSSPYGPRTATGTLNGVAFAGAACTDYFVLWRVRPEAAGQVDPGTAGLESILCQDVFPRVVDVTDGTSNTLLINEDTGRPDIWINGQLVTAGLRETDAPYASRDNDTSFWGFDLATNTAPGVCAINCTNNNGVYSFHPGGCNAAFGDGSVRFMRQTVTTRQYARLVTRSGGEVANWDDY
jgi:prepilin-type processing-associated H-X9-DG protein